MHLMSDSAVCSGLVSVTCYCTCSPPLSNLNMILISPPFDVIVKSKLNFCEFPVAYFKWELLVLCAEVAGVGRVLEGSVCVFLFQ